MSTTQRKKNPTPAQRRGSVGKPVTLPCKTTGSQRHDELLVRTFGQLGSALSKLEEILQAIPFRQHVQERVKLLEEAKQGVEAAQQHASLLFDEGAEWLRKYNALETLFGHKGDTPDMEHFAGLFFAYSRYFETGLPALGAIATRIVQCEACTRATDLPFAILRTNCERLQKESAKFLAVEKRKEG